MLSSRRTWRCAASLALLLVSEFSSAKAPAPAVAVPVAVAVDLAAPAAAVSQTTQASFTATGRVTSAAPIAGVHWVNQFGRRGSGTWSGPTAPATSSAPAQAATWTIANIPLRLGVNQFTVTVVDVANHSASLRFAINRVLAPGTAPASAAAAPTSGAGGAKAAATGVHTDGLAVGQPSLLWGPAVGGIVTIPYTITLQPGVTGEPAPLTAAITQFNNTFSGLLKLAPAGSPLPANYVAISVFLYGGGEGSSSVGMVGGGQPLSCGTDCDSQTWLHEFGHTVGLYHEHQRPDSANFITLNLANSDLPNYLNLTPLDVPNALNLPTLGVVNQSIGLYDYASVMHYGAFDFTKAGLPVLESIPAGIPLSNATGYSAGDIDAIHRLYGAAPSQVTITTNPVGLQFIVDGQTAYTSPHTFAFALNSTHTLSLPADPQVTNPADGDMYLFANWNDLGSRTHDITIHGGSGSLTDPAGSPAVTVYQANFIRLQPFAIAAAYPAGTGSASASPPPLSENGNTFYVDRTLVQLTAAPAAGYQFAGWYDLFPNGANPYSFYITAPTTGDTAPLFAPTASQPVTILGESITGPNTWNPGIPATVDPAATYPTYALLPQAFSSVIGDTAWNAGMQHTIQIAQAQSPVTTNVYYNWNSWSDAGSISHTITQPASGTQTISASVTPYYASFTLTNGACAGGVATSPPGTAYSQNGSYLFYADGTKVTTTATPVSPLEFAGWSGSLFGVTTNPTPMTVVHDQFVAAAAFNLSSTPVTITSLNPPVAAVSAAGTLNVTINGTGFTPASAVNFNNSRRSSTYVNPNQLTVQLTAGDLASPGVQTVVVVNGASTANGNCSVAATAQFTVTSTAPAGGYPLILWQNSNGAVVEWSMDGGLVASSANLSTVPSGWSVFGTGDFAGTGATDILWRNTTSGDIVIWFVTAGAVTSSANLGAITTSWIIAGTGDYNGDGKTDILWHNTASGDTVIWYMNGGSIASSSDFGVISTTWSIAGTADFNGDGIPDILWRNSNGDTVIWFLSSAGTVASSADFGVVPTTWSIADTGNFDGKGKSDILWRNSNGDTVIWFLNGGTITASTDLGTVPSSWTVAGVRDYNGDGKSDILWRNSSGDAVIWFMNGGAVASSTDLGVVPTSWTIVGGAGRGF